MLIGLCQKCDYPLWFGTVTDKSGATTCPLCELEQDIVDTKKVDHVEWRDLILGNDQEHAQIRNTFHLDMRAVAEKMDLPNYLAEWKLLVQDDIEPDSKEVSIIFREEIRCLIERILKRLNERSAPH